MSDYNRVVKLNPEDDRAYYDLANTKMAVGDFGGGLGPINKAIELKPDNASYYKMKGNIQFRMNQPCAACKSWQKALELGDNKSQYNLDQYCK